MAENKTINIKINQNADKAEKSFKSYNKELGNTKKQYDAVLKSGKPFDQQLEDINKIVKETPLNVRDMNKQIQAYQSIALSAGRETPVGKQALEQAAQLRDRYIDIQNETKRLADDQRNLEGAIQGISTGVAIYGGVQSAMALSGVESEKLRETLVKLQAAQTLMNSINQVATAFEKESALMLTLKSAKTKALTVATAAYSAVTGTTTGVLKAFRIALASTGIGALVAGIGLLIANFDKVLKLFSPIIDGLKSMGDAIGLTNFAEEEQNQERKRRAEEQRMRIEAERKQRDNAFKQRQGQFDREIALLEAEGKSTVELTKQKIESSIAYQKEKVKEIQLELKGLEIFEKAYAGSSAFEKLARKEAKKLRDEREAEILELNNNISDSENQLKINVINNNKKKAASYKAYVDKKEAQRQKDEQRERKRLKNLENLENKFQDRIAKIEEENYQNTLTDEERELRAVQDKYFELETLAEGNADALNAIEIARLNEENEIKQKYATEAYNNQKALDDKAEAEQKARQARDLENEKIAAEAKQKLQEAQLANVEAGIAVFKNLAGENKKLQAVAIAAESAASIAKTIITTQSANAAATAQGAALAIPTAGASVAAAAAAVVQNNISAGISIAAQIAAAAKGISALGGGASAPSGSAPSGGGAGGGEVISPEFNVVGESGINQLAQLQQQPLQAYVVSGEVTTGQALDRNRVQNATL